MCSYLDPFYWSQKDWVLLSSFFGALGSVLLVKGIILNEHGEEEAKSFWGGNPFLAKGVGIKRWENIIGIIYIFISFALQFLTVFLPLRWNIPICNLMFGKRLFLILGIMLLITLISFFVPRKITLNNFRSKNSKNYLKILDEHIAEVKSGYLRKDLREIPEESRKKINNMDQVVMATRNLINENMNQIEKLFSFKGYGNSDLERLENLKRKLAKWAAE